MGFAYANETSDLFPEGFILLSFASNGFIDKFILSPWQNYPLLCTQNAKSELLGACGKNRGSKTTVGCRPNLPTGCFINKVLLAHSCVHSFANCL